MRLAQHLTPRPTNEEPPLVLCLVCLPHDLPHDLARDLPREPDDRARERAELRDGHKYEDLPDGPAQAQGHEEESHVLAHPREDVDLIEHDEADAASIVFPSCMLYIRSSPSPRERGRKRE